MKQTVWKSRISSPQRGLAIEVLRKLATKFQDSNNCLKGIASARSQSEYFHWHDYHYAHFAMFFCELDRLLPGEGYFVLAHRYLLKAIEASKECFGISMFEGTTGIGMAAQLLHERFPRYASLLSSIDHVINKHCASLLIDIRCSKSIPEESFDLISGLSGIARYFICRANAGVAQPQLAPLLQVLIDLSAIDGQGIPEYKTKPQDLVGSLSNYKFGLVNLGLAHGIAGPLTIMSLAIESKLEIPMLKIATKRLVQFFVDNISEDEFGLGWPGLLPLNEEQQIAYGGGELGSSWCYGSASIAQAVGRAVNAVETPEFVSVTTAATSAAVRRSLKNNDLHSLTLCHGKAGLFLNLLHAFNDGACEYEIESARIVFDDLLNGFDADTAFGFQNNEKGTCIDDPKFLSGSIGIGLVLIAAMQDTEPLWDRMLLLK
ncbi:MAG: lanthionine synthetase C family protein [Candidatus Obscuribacterales bacterium]|jgi:hypothetical protein